MLCFAMTTTTTTTIKQVLVDTEELGHNEQDAPLAWFGAQPPPRPAPFKDPTLPRSFLRTPKSVSTDSDKDDDTDDRGGDGNGNGNGDGDGNGTRNGDTGNGGDGQEEKGRQSVRFGSGRDGGGETGGVGTAAAGVGAAHVLTGPGRLEDDAWEEASSACPWMR